MTVGGPAVFVKKFMDNAKLREYVKCESSYSSRGLKKCTVWLSNRKHLNSMKRLFTSKPANHYRDAADYLLCNLFPKPHKEFCVVYYARHGRSFTELYSTTAVADYDERILGILRRYYKNRNWTFAGLQNAKKEG